MQMVFSNNGTGKRPAPPLIKQNILIDAVKIQKPMIDSYTMLNKYGMIKRIQITSTCKNCGK